MRRGEFRRRANTIVLDARLTARQVVACLAHELGHASLGHGCSTPANEQRAWEYAAALVVTPAEYAAAGAVGPDPLALALELSVTPRLVEAWRRWWLTRGRSSTVASRAGEILGSMSRTAARLRPCSVRRRTWC